MVARDVDLPPIWLAGFAALGAIVAWIVPFGLPYHAKTGAALVVLGLAIMFAAVVQLVWARTTVIPGRDPSRMVTSGLYAVSRNPIYLADAILLSGLYVYWGATLALPFVALFMLLISRRFIDPEEERLARVFGPAFLSYKNRTRRWI